MHDKFQARRRDALRAHGVEKTSQLPDDAKLSLRTEFNQYTGAVRTHALFELRDIVD